MSNVKALPGNELEEGLALCRDLKDAGKLRCIVVLYGDEPNGDAVDGTSFYSSGPMAYSAIGALEFVKQMMIMQEAEVRQ